MVPYQLETKEEAEEKSAGDSDDWAVAVDTKDPVKDFYKRIPDLAYKVSSDKPYVMPPSDIWLNITKISSTIYLG